MAALTEADRERRRKGLGGSDAPAVFDIGYHTRFTLWADKVWGTRDRSTPQQERGHDLEEMIAVKAARKLGIADIWPGGWNDHPDHGWMFANLDWETDGVIIECKATDHQWKGWEWGPDGDPEGLPARIDYQVHHQLEVTGAELCIVAALFIDTWELRTYEIKPDRELAAVIVDAEHRFWHDHVLAEAPPAIKDGPNAWDTLRALCARPGSAVHLPDEAREIIPELLTVSAARLAHEKHEKALKAELGRLLGDGEIGLIDGDPAVTFKNAAGGSRRLIIPTPYQRSINHGTTN